MAGLMAWSIELTITFILLKVLNYEEGKVYGRRTTRKRAN